MNAALLRAIVDTLLPGDGVLPGGSASGVALTEASAREPALHDIARRAGGAEAFISATPAQRIDAIKAFAAEEPDAFRALLLLPLLQDYYESDLVLQALGWPARPPQPLGHDLAAIDAETSRRIDNVRHRGPIWRKC